MQEGPHTVRGVSGGDELPLVRGRLPGWLRRTRTVLAPGGRLAYDPRVWTCAIIVVERGVIELEACSGERVRLARGSLLWLAGLPLRALHNPGEEPTTLVAIAKRAAAETEETTG